MAKAKFTDEEFKQLFVDLGPRGMAEKFGIDRRNLQRRRRSIERKHHISIAATQQKYNSYPVKRISEYPGWASLEVKNGIVLVGSDAHIWPGPMSTAMRGFIHFAKLLKPKAVILNGDGLDFPRISRHAPIGWTHTPTVVDEIEAAQEQLGLLEQAAGKAVKLWPLGNHDARYETRLATVAPEYAKLHGTSLQDFFPLWQPCWSVQINENIVVKHRFKGGIHATHNNVLWSGMSMVTGHLHSGKVVPFNDYTNDTKYGVDTGCLANVHSRAFLYNENNPVNWRSGFCVLTFIDGKLLQPELVYVWEEKDKNGYIQFRGELIKV